MLRETSMARVLHEATPTNSGKVLQVFEDCAKNRPARYVTLCRFVARKIDIVNDHHSECWVLPNILSGGVPHGSQNPDPISDQNMIFHTPFQT